MEVMCMWRRGGGGRRRAASAAMEVSCAAAAATATEGSCRGGLERAAAMEDFCRCSGCGSDGRSYSSYSNPIYFLLLIFIFNLKCTTQTKGNIWLMLKCLVDLRSTILMWNPFCQFQKLVLKLTSQGMANIFQRLFPNQSEPEQ
jgi:hypothetical protein